MRIVFTGGGTGGHLYPLLAVIDSVQEQRKENLECAYLGPWSPFEWEFKKRKVSIRRIVGSKLRRYFALQNFLDVFKLPFSILQALYHLYVVMPDAVFSKGGPGAFPVVLSAWWYRIPVLIHESDSVPGLTNRFSAIFAKRIGISFAGAAESFPKRKVAFVGNPVRTDLLKNRVERDGTKTELGFDSKLPLLFVIGGSQGSKRINSFIIENLNNLLPVVQIYHQVGTANLEEVRELSNSVLKSVSGDIWSRYRFVPYLEGQELLKAYCAADIVISRAGSGAIYEVASFGRPSIFIPLRDAANDHQRENAFEYAKTGAAMVLEEGNQTIHLFLRMIDSVLKNPETRAKMEESAKLFYRSDSAEMLAKELLILGEK